MHAHIALTFRNKHYNKRDLNIKGAWLRWKERKMNKHDAMKCLRFYSQVLTVLIHFLRRWIKLINL